MTRMFGAINTRSAVVLLILALAGCDIARQLLKQGIAPLIHCPDGQPHLCVALMPVQGERQTDQPRVEANKKRVSWLMQQ